MTQTFQPDAPTSVLFIRISDAQKAEVEAYAELMRKKYPGIRISAAAAARELLAAGLAEKSRRR